MADIELVIKIPEELTKKGRWYTDEEMRVVIKATQNGTPLPKGHGRLIDADKVKHAFIKWSMAVQGSFTDADIASIVCNSPTIIEADKAESENSDE